MRILSLIPEATEILGALGLGDQVMEAWHTAAARVGRSDARPFTTDLLVEASPTLIFTSETAAGGGLPRHLMRRVVGSQYQRLGSRPAVYALEPHTLGEILSDIKTVGDATGRQGQARALIEALRERIDAVSLRAARAAATYGPRRVACLTADDPPCASGWWLAELIGLAGGLDVLDGAARPPRLVTLAEIQATRPELIVHLASMGVVATPGPAAVDLVERFVALIVPPEPRALGDAPG